ncbi:MAG: glycosyltransferase family 4 protein [Pseudomonadales bacterium]|nr:glycosyltransferase family 4 protein [Pseudomonadales bacterium]MCP5183575.1 glycosyltransferase family 4 protein [Pseudomonadales bacterium]
MKRVLFVSSYPFPMNMGSRQHAYYMIRALAEQHEVHCLFFLPSDGHLPEDALSQLGPLGVVSVSFLHFREARKRGRFAGVVRSLFSYPISHMVDATHADGLAEIHRLVRTYAIEVIHYESLWYTKYAFSIKDLCKQVVVYHDLHHEVIRRMANDQRSLVQRLVLRLDAAKLLFFEKRLDSVIDLKIFLNPEELKRLPEHAVHIPHIANADVRYEPPLQKRICNILFLGAYNHPPNRQSFEYIIDQMLPRLVTVLGDGFQIHVVGPGTEKFGALVQNSAFRDRIQIHGFVEKLQDAFSTMDIALFPIFSGGGIKTKVLDAMAAGLPVVTSPDGVHGLADLPEESVAVGKDSAELVQHIVDLTENFDRRLACSRQAFAYVQREHSYQAFCGKVLTAFALL